MPLLLRTLRKKRANLVNLNAIALKELQKEMDKKVGPTLVRSHKRIVQNWEHKPDFESKTQIRSDIIITTIYPIGENASIWLFVDQGTKPHEIKPKVAPRLIFQTGYTSKTLAKPARTVSGGGNIQRSGSGSEKSKSSRYGSAGVQQNDSRGHQRELQ